MVISKKLQDMIKEQGCLTVDQYVYRLIVKIEQLQKPRNKTW